MKILTFDQTSQLRLETRLIISNYTKKYNTNLGSRKIRFPQFIPYSALIWPSSDQSGLNV